MRIHGDTTAQDLVDLHPLLGRIEAAICLGQYRDLEHFCHEHNIDAHHIQVCIKARPYAVARWAQPGGGPPVDRVYFFFEMGGGDAAAWIAPPPPEHIWGDFRPKAEARVYWPGPPPLAVVQRGAWIYPLETP